MLEVHEEFLYRLVLSIVCLLIGIFLVGLCFFGLGLGLFLF